MTTLMARREPTSQVKDSAKLNAVRKRKGFTYESLAEAAGVSRAMIGHFVTGRTVTCKQSTGERIEDALGVKRGSLFKKPDYQVLVERRGSRALPVAKPEPVEQVIEAEK